MVTRFFELPVHFDDRRYASVQEAKLRSLARRYDNIALRRTWYGMKLIGPEEGLLSALIDLAGHFKLGRMRPRGPNAKC